MAHVFDLEGDNLYDDITVIHCAVFTELPSMVKTKFYPDQIEEMLIFMDSCPVLIGHNVQGFDFPSLEKLYGYVYQGQVYDTMMLSFMSNPDRYGGHSVAAWAKNLKLDQQKVEHEDWSTFTPEMMHRCSTDVDIQVQIYYALKRELVAQPQYQIDWALPIKLEHSIQRIITDQEHRGVPFNTPKAEIYFDYIEKEIVKIRDEVDHILGHAIFKENTRKNVLLKSGEYNQATLNKFGDLLSDGFMKKQYEVVGAYTPVSFKQITPSMYDKVKAKMMDMGWKPSEYTEKGNPKMPDADELGLFADRTGNEGLKALSFYGKVKNRHGILNTWIRKSKERGGTLPAGAFTCGTPTARFKHTTVTNVPKVSSVKGTGELIYAPEKQKVFFGTEMRSLFYNGHNNDYKIVGADAAGLELRCLAHYMNKEAFINEVLSGDIHTLFWEAAGGITWILSRDDMKGVTYCWLYGGGNALIATLCTAKKGEPQASWGATVRSNLLKGVDGLEALVNYVTKMSERGFFRGLDGRKIHMRKKDGKVQTHKSLNTLLQSTGSILVKMWTHMVDQEIKKQGLDARQIIHMHDEMQFLCHNKDVPKLEAILKDKMIKAGEYFNFNIPLEADVKVGVNWAETH